MTALEFLRLAEVQGLLQRAQRAAGVPLSLHYLERNQEGPRIAGWGGCEACAFVGQVPGGRQACRQSRQTVSGMAVRQGRALPFICHMGFSCVSVPALEGEGFVLTFGPFCPAEEARSLPHDALAGLKALLVESGAGDAEIPEQFPVPLGDIHRAPSGAVPEIAAWTVESLRARWRALRQEDASRAADEAGADAVMGGDESAVQEPARPKHRRGRKSSHGAALDVAELTAAVAGSDFVLARKLFATALREAQPGRRYQQARAANHAIAVISAMLEKLGAAHTLNPAAWEIWPETMQALRACEDRKALLEESVRFFRLCQRRQRARRAADTSQPNGPHAAVALQYAALNKVISERLPERVSLQEVARELGETPSAITHRLQRKFGMNYSEYLGRLRVDRAKDLLRRTQLSATEVARRVGIRDQSNFGKIFKKYAGMTPQDYRRTHGRKP